MAIALRGTSSGGNGSLSTLTLTKPTGVVSGDLLLAHITLEGSAAITAPAGWKQYDAVNDGSHVWCSLWYKFAGSSEPSSYSWTYSSTWTDAVLVAYSGVDPVTPFDVTGSHATTASGTLSLPSITTVTAGVMLLITAGNFSGGDCTASGYTKEVTNSDGTDALDEKQAAAGATGTVSVTDPGNQCGGFLVGLRPGGIAALSPNWLTVTPLGYTFPAVLAPPATPYAPEVPTRYVYPVGSPGGGVSISATLQGVGSLSVAPLTVQVNSVTLAGVGSLAVAPLTVQVNSVTLAGVGSLSVSPLTVQLQGVTLAGVGSLALTPLTVQLQNVTLGGVGSLSATLVQQELGAAWPTVTPAGFTFPVGVIPPPAPYREITPLAYTEPVGSPPSGAVSVTATLQGVGALTLAPLTVQVNAVTLAGVGTLSASPLTVQLVGVTLPGVGSLALAPLTVQLNSVTLVGMGVLALSPLTVQVQSVSLSGVGALSLAVLTAQLQGVALSGAGTLAAAFTVLLGAQALRGVGSLAGTPQVLGANSLVDATVTALVRDGTVTLLVRDGKASALVRDGDNTTEVR